MPADDLDQLVERLRAAGCVFAEDEAALLLAEATDPADLERRVASRVGGQPLEVVLGWADFAGVRVVVAPGVFVPRQRTRLLVDLAAELVGRGAPATVVVDLGCGTGAIAAALRHRAPGLEVWAVDLDPAAVACAQQNLPPERVLTGDLYDALPTSLRGRVDLLVANAPYVPTDQIALMPREARDHEHPVALDGGLDGLDIQRRVVAGAAGWLRPGGHLLIETSSRQADRSRALLEAAGMGARVVRDQSPDGPGGCVVIGVNSPEP